MADTSFHNVQRNADAGQNVLGTPQERKYPQIKARKVTRSFTKVDVSPSDCGTATTRHVETITYSGQNVHLQNPTKESLLILP